MAGLCLANTGAVPYNKYNCFVGYFWGKKVHLLNKHETKRGGTQNRRSFLLTLALIALIGSFTISLVSLQFQISEKNQQLAAAQQTLITEKEKNAELKDLAKEDDEKAYMERIARDVLGYVLPGESVYYDIASGN